MSTTSSLATLELWGGIECTVNRVGDRFRDQVVESGHQGRPEDIDQFAEIGLRTLRYPALWERAQPTLRSDIQWSWIDQRLARLRSLGIRPILGLVHHGSGPPGTSLVDESFVWGLANYGRQLAERHPWIEDYTPVNEPLTTARFSGLYGHWYPHGRETRIFQRALLVQCRAIAETMRAIRLVNPAARLVQTDDLGFASSTPDLAYQAEFENERRWLGWDLLSGRVGRLHPLFGYLTEAGAGERELLWFVDNPCPPDIIGVNHYVTSDRFLDGQLSKHPGWTHGGNGHHRYADVETVRIRPGQGTQLAAALLAAAERYRRPLAITECHLGCTREQQMRWLVEVWETAMRQRELGADIRAVTVWALLGLIDWSSLVTERRGQYEPGAFDVRSSVPRRTGLGNCVAQLAAGENASHPVLGTPGWWRVGSVGGDSGRVLMVIGAGSLGKAFARICRLRGLACRLVPHTMLDVVDKAAMQRALALHQPWAIVNATGCGGIDPAERNFRRCRRTNIVGPVALAGACRGEGLPLVTFSSHLVFDGRLRRPYHERDAVGPLNAYGRSKVEAERQVLDILPEALIIRTGDFFGPWDRRNFIREALGILRAGRLFAAAEDLVVSPTYLPDAVHACLDLLIDGERGVWHLSNIGEVTWLEFARTAAARAGLITDHVIPCSAAMMGCSAPRPAYSVLGSERGGLLRPLDEALTCYFSDCEINAENIPM